MAKPIIDLVITNLRKPKKTGANWSSRFLVKSNFVRLYVSGNNIGGIDKSRIAMGSLIMTGIKDYYPIHEIHPASKCQSYQR